MSCFIHRILTFIEATQFCKIKILNAQGKDMTEIYKYSWSSDGLSWTEWVCYKDYCRIASCMESDFYLRIHVSDSIGDVFLNGLQTKCYNVCIEPTNIISDACSDPNLWQPYANLDCALLLQQQLADNIVCLFGIPVYYFKCDPVQSSADFTFKEFVMHSVTSVKQLKMMVQDGEMPSSNPKLTELDFGWEEGWQTELSKTQFAKAFGDTAIPKAQDFIYVPLMKRMWEVNAAYDEKNEGLMWRSTTWKLTLVKYEDSTNVLTEGFDAIIDNFIQKTYDNTFKEREDNEQERLTGSDQVSAPKSAFTNLYNIFMEDGTRKAYTKNDAEIIDKILCDKNSVVVRNLYKFKNTNGCIQYQKGLCGDSGMISFIIETPGHLKTPLDRPIAEFGPITFELGYDEKEEEFVFGFEDMRATLQPFTTYLVVYQWDKKNYVRELKIYSHVHRTDFPVYMLRPEHYWFDFDNPQCIVAEYNSDHETQKEEPCQINPWPLHMTNIKYYNRYLGEEAKQEACKYTTTHESCIINDLARPIFSGQGFAVK